MEQTHKTISETKALSRMANLCARREYCVFDIETKLQRYNLENDIIKSIIAKLKNEKYIDELRFTRSFIRDKIRFNKWGRTKILYTLRQKRVPENIVNEAFLDFTDNDLNDSLQELLEAKWNTIKGNSDYEKQTKLIRFGLSRGFDMANILQCIKNLK
jgi:regulatory protein